MDIDGEQFDTVLGMHDAVVLDVWAGWCGPCKQMARVIGDVSDRFGWVVFYRSNMDEDPLLAKRLNVVRIPTLLFFDKGKLVDTVVGAVSDHELARRVWDSFSKYEDEPRGPF
jgi:thioredoxin